MVYASFSGGMEGRRKDVHASLLLSAEWLCEWLGKRCIQYASCWGRGAMCYERYSGICFATFSWNSSA